MGRSNNQRRRTSKKTGQAYIPAWTKSKTKRLANKQKEEAYAKQGKKLSYNKMVTNHGKVTHRKFRAGGYNSSGKLGSARATKSATKKGSGKKKAGQQKARPKGQPF